jgi:hypothetical protein
VVNEKIPCPFVPLSLQPSTPFKRKEFLTMMKRPPRGLTDKDMIKNYVEEKSVEAQLMTAAKKAEKRRLADAADAPPEPFAKAGFTKSKRRYGCGGKLK